MLQLFHLGFQLVIVNSAWSSWYLWSCMLLDCLWSTTALEKVMPNMNLIMFKDNPTMMIGCLLMCLMLFCVWPSSELEWLMQWFFYAWVCILNNFIVCQWCINHFDRIDHHFVKIKLDLFILINCATLVWKPLNVLEMVKWDFIFGLNMLFDWNSFGLKMFWPLHSV